MEDSAGHELGKQGKQQARGVVPRPTHLVVALHFTGPGASP